MMKRLIFPVGVLVVVFVVAGVLVPLSVQGQTEQLCTMPQDLKYSPGAVETFQGQTYKCLVVYGENLSPRGVAWVKVRITGVEQPVVP